MRVRNKNPQQTPNDGRFRTLAALGAALVFAGGTSLAETSQLWGGAGELWDNGYPAGALSARIADVSHAGYRGGDVPIPFYAVAIDATAAPYNAIPDDGLDDSAAIQAALDTCPSTGAAVFLPEGTYNLTSTVTINKPNVVLRGAGEGRTVIRALNGIVALYMEGSPDKRGLASVDGFSRGDTQISNSALSSNAAVGDLIYLQISLNESVEGYDYLIEQNVGGVEIPQFSAGRIANSMYAQVVGLAGKVVTLDRPLEFTFQGGTKKWGLGIMTPTVHDSGIEDLTITFDPGYPYAKHFNGTAPGPDNEEDVTSKGTYLRGVVNCWVRNIEVREACSALSMYGENVQCTVTGVTLVAERMSQSEFPLQSGLDFDYAMQFDTPLVSRYWDIRGHAGVALAGSHLLAERIDMKYAALHDLTVNNTKNCVFSDIRGVDISLDHHRHQPSRNLYTQIDTGLGRKVWLSSGVNADGIQCGAWETFWNIDSAKEQDFPPYDPGTGTSFCRGFLNIVGIHTLEAPVTDASPRWFEADIGPGELDQPNLYEAMRIKRFAENGWDATPPVAAATASATVGTGSLSLNFTGSGSSDNTGIVSTLWNFGDGFSSWETNPQHTYTAPGIYTATLTVRDARNLRDTAEVEITVLDPSGQYTLAYKLAGSAALENHALGTGHAIFGATSQVVAGDASASTVVAVPGAGYRFIAWSDGVRSAARTDTNVIQSMELTAYFMEGTAPVAGNPPTDLALDASTVNEAAPNGTLVGTLTATDPDPGETFIYQLTDDAGGRFALDASTGRLTVADSASIVYAAAATHTIAVLVIDGTSQTCSESFTIDVTSAAPPGPGVHPGTVAGVGGSPAGGGGILAGAEGIQTRTREVIRTDTQQIAIGQSFRLAALQAGEHYALSAICLKSKTAEDFDTYTDSLQIKVFSGTGSGATLLGTFTYDLGNQGDGTTTSDVAAGQWVRFELGPGLDLDVGGDYSFLAFFDAGSGANDINKWGFLRDDSGIYAEGGQFEGRYNATPAYVAGDWDAAPWNNMLADGNDDFMFHIGGTVVAAPATGYTAWIAGHPALTGDDALPTGDPDRDGMENFLEYAFALDPTAADPFPYKFTPVTGSENFEMTVPNLRDGVTCEVQASTDMIAWNPFTTLPGHTGGTPTTVTIPASLAAGRNRLFVRIRVENTVP